MSKPIPLNRTLPLPPCSKISCCPSVSQRSDARKSPPHLMADASDGGVMLFAEVEKPIGIADRLAALIADPRNPLLVTHSVADIFRARMLAIAWPRRSGLLRENIARRVAIIYYGTNRVRRAERGAGRSRLPWPIRRSLSGSSYPMGHRPGREPHRRRGQDWTPAGQRSGCAACRRDQVGGMCQPGLSPPARREVPEVRAVAVLVVPRPLQTFGAASR